MIPLLVSNFIVFPARSLCLDSAPVFGQAKSAIVALNCSGMVLGTQPIRVSFKDTGEAMSYPTNIVLTDRPSLLRSMDGIV
ncbi:hypothetical protein V6N13_066779 [Hibiscus sabdariffa]